MTEASFSQKWQTWQQRAPATNCSLGNSDCILGKNSSPGGWYNTFRHRRNKKEQEHPFLQVSKTQLNKIMAYLLVDLLQEGGYTRWPAEVLFNQNGYGKTECLLKCNNRCIKRALKSYLHYWFWNICIKRSYPFEDTQT